MKANKRRKSSTKGADKASKAYTVPDDYLGGDKPYIPREVVQVIGTNLSCTDLCAARTVCRFWSEHITEATQRVVTQLHPDAIGFGQKLGLIRKLFPVATSFCVKVSGRVSQTIFADYLAQLANTRTVKELHLLFVTAFEAKYIPQNPFPPVRNYEGVTKLRSLTSLTIQDGRPPSSKCLKALGDLTALTKLAIVSKDIDEKNSTHEQDHWLGQAQLEQLKGLKGLRHLEVPLASSGSRDHVAHLTELTNLTCLFLRGQPLATVALEHVTRMTRLQRLGLSISEEVPDVRHVDLHTMQQLRSLELQLVNRDLETCDDMAYMHERLTGCLVSLTLKRCILSSSSSSHLTALTSLTSLAIKEPTNFPLDLGCLSTLTGLKSLTFAKTIRDPADQNPTLNFASLASSLTGLTQLVMRGLLNEEAPPGVFDHLSQMTQLADLVLEAADSTKHLIKIPWQALPQSLRSLTLKYCLVACPIYHARLRHLESMNLTFCQMECLSHFQCAVEGLRNLSSLKLSDMPGITDTHLSHLSALTNLTELAVSAVSNQHITNGGLNNLTTLTKLAKLTWLAGDMLDFVLEPTVLKQFSNLHVLHITTSMYYRMSRWSVLHVMDFLPFCQVESSGL